MINERELFGIVQLFSDVVLCYGEVLLKQKSRERVLLILESDFHSGVFNQLLLQT